MTTEDRMKLLREMCDKHSQAEVARRLGYKPSTICQILSGEYGGNPGRVLTRCEEVYGSSVIECPYLGEISMGKCAEMRKRPAAAVNPDWVKMLRRCKKCGGKP